MRHPYWWIVTYDPNDGTPILVFGSDKSEDDARVQGLETYGLIEFEIKKLYTRDRTTASAMLRGSRLKENKGNITEARRRIGHEKTLKRRITQWNL